MALFEKKTCENNSEFLAEIYFIAVCHNTGCYGQQVKTHGIFINTNFLILLRRNEVVSFSYLLTFHRS